MTTVNIDVSRLGGIAKNEMIASMSMDIAFTQSDLDYYKAELERKVQVIGEMQKTITRLEGELTQAKKDAQRDATCIHDLFTQIDGFRKTVAQLHAEKAQPPRNYNLESCEGLLKVCHSVAHGFYKAIAEGRYGEAVYLEPTAVTERLNAIPQERKIERLKVLRQIMPGLGLKEAKDYIDTRYHHLNDCPF